MSEENGGGKPPEETPDAEEQDLEKVDEELNEAAGDKEKETKQKGEKGEKKGEGNGDNKK